MVQTFVNTLADNDEQVTFADWDVSDTQQFGDLLSAIKAVDLKLLDYKQRYKGATIVVIQSELSPDKLAFMGMPSLINEFPYSKCP